MLYDITVPQFTKMLQNLSKILDKSAEFADSKKFDVAVLLNSRLAPDQFNFIRQVQITCDTAKLGVSRLTGKEAPKHDDSEKSVADLKKRIDETVAYLKTFSAKDFQGAEERTITNPYWQGKTMKGFDYLAQHALPNFYFHFTTAYSILRNNGMDVGKKDFLGELPYQK